MAEDIESDFEGVWYHWTCGACGAMCESENDVRGAEAECDACGATSTVTGTI